MNKNRKVLLTLITFFLVLSLPVILFAEVTSSPCPYSCKTRGISKDRCKDWKEGNTCFVDDLQASQAIDTSHLERKILLVNKNLLAGKNIELKLPNNNPIDHFDVVVRRNGGTLETLLSVSLGGTIPFGMKQVDKNENHVIQFLANGTRAEKRRLLLTAVSGDIFIESVHVLTQ